MRPSGDSQLIELVDIALADAGWRSGPHLFCHPGCTPCCHGVFAISSLDVARLKQGLADRLEVDPEGAGAILTRVQEVRERLAPSFPGDATSGWLGTDESSQEHFENFADEEPCPILNPVTGTCDLYDHRPMTCRIFGPPIRSEGGLGVCDLCFRGANDAEIKAAEMYLPDPAVEASLTDPLGVWTTIIPFAFGTQPT